MTMVMKFLRLAAKVRYWRQRTIRLERELAETKAAAKAEYYRNMMREDTFVSAAVLGGRGMIGMSPRNGPAEIPQPPRIVTASDPWNAISGSDLMEFNTQWLPLGLEKGLTVGQIRQDFLRELGNRKAFNDEPMN